VLRAGAVRPEVDREMQEWVRRVQAFAGEALDDQRHTDGKWRAAGLVEMSLHVDDQERRPWRRDELA